MKKWTKSLAVVVFGIALPLVVLTQAYVSVMTLRDDVNYKMSLDELRGLANGVHESKWGANEYALFSLLYVEDANKKTMINKQRMKTAIISIGFSVISVGMMFIILGIEAGRPGGLEAGGGVGDLRIDFRTGSTGVAVFVVGAIMATLGGVLKNEYVTSRIPNYAGNGGSELVERYRSASAGYRACSREGDAKEECFYQYFSKLESGEME